MKGIYYIVCISFYEFWRWLTFCYCHFHCKVFHWLLWQGLFNPFFGEPANMHVNVLKMTATFPTNVSRELKVFRYVEILNNGNSCFNFKTNYWIKSTCQVTIFRNICFSGPLNIRLMIRFDCNGAYVWKFV